MKKLILFFLMLCPQLVSAQEKAVPAAVLYYSDHCSHCLRFKKEVLPGLKEKYGARVRWGEVCVDQPDNLAMFWAVVKHYRGEDAKPYIPSMEVGDNILIGGEELRDNLTGALDEAIAKGEFGNGPRPSAQELKKEFSAFSASAVAGSGLIDGINPCAFAVIVFFISFLAVYGYSRAEIVVVGSAYCLGVFLAYMLIGLGILRALYALSGFYYAMKVFYYLMSAACFAFAALSVRDYLLYKKTGSAEGFALQLPQALKLKINKVMGLLRRKDGSMGMGRLFAAAFVVGIMVSVIEAVCTGQVYVPTLAYIMKDPALRAKALAYLLLYNLMFIVPLVAVFALSLAGCSSERFSGFFKRRLGAAKLLLAALFAGLGVLLLVLS